MVVRASTGTCTRDHLLLDNGDSEILADNVVGRLRNQHGRSLWIAHREVPFHRQVRLAGKPAQPDGTPVGSAEARDAARLMRGLAIAIRKDDGSCVLEEVALLLE